MNRHHHLVAGAVGLGILCVPLVSAAGDIQIDGTYVSTVPTGAPPLQVGSTTKVENLNADLLDGVDAATLLATPETVVDVAMSGGDFASIQGAIDSIADAASDKWYVIRVAPGVYHETVTLKPFVSLVGHGRFETRIVAEAVGDVVAVSNAGSSVITRLAIEARSTGGSATGVVDPLVIREGSVTADATSPGHAVGVQVTGAGFTTLYDTWVTATDGDVNSGMLLESPGEAVVVDGEVFAQSIGNPSATNYAIRKVTVTGSSYLELERVRLNAAGGSVGWGIDSANGITEVRRSSITGNATSKAVGIQLAGSTLILQESEVLWSGSATTKKGIEALTGLTQIRSSTIRADTALEAATGATLEAAYTQATGSVIDSGGTFACIGLYDATMAAVTCP